MAVGAAVVVTGTLLPWVRTGGRRRNSYDVLGARRAPGLPPDGATATALRWWPVVPVLVVFGRRGDVVGMASARWCERGSSLPRYAGTIAAIVDVPGLVARPRARPARP